MEVTDPRVMRVAKDFDALNAKLAKLSEENLRLKKQLADLKQSQSRVRRIPKKDAAEPVESPES